jgi:acyl-CoA synthetase (AMP-forming)/AMP-acid ligase II
MIQYTSGSTSNPKGVMLSHGNLMHNLALIREGFQLGQEEVGLFWLPPYHDMGLIGGILEPMYVMGSAVLMSPAFFLQRPARWLQMISRHRATISGAPNFAFNLCVEKITPEQMSGLDLSRWRVAFCGAEPIHHETLKRFHETFAPYGFRRDAFYPCYGLAEATLFACGGCGPSSPVMTHVQREALEQNLVVPASVGASDSMTLVGCGRSLPGQQVLVVHPEQCVPVAEGQVGEIWIAGPSVAQGYLHRQEESALSFRAELASGEGPFLRTGDLER